MIVESDLLLELNLFIVLHLLLENGLLLHLVRVLFIILVVVVRVSLILHLVDPLVDTFISKLVLLELRAVVDVLGRVREVVLVSVID